MPKTLLPPSATQNLAQAMIESSTAPLILLDGELNVVALSASFCRSFGIDRAAAVGMKLTSLGTGEWALPQLEALLVATGSGFAEIEAYEMDLKREGHSARRLIVNAHKLHYDLDELNIRMLVAVTDVTDERAATKIKDELLRDKAVLLQELQHRVANSLQIVASVLMQSARRVQSDEARAHISDAHSRVMSIAALQQQLTSSQIGEVQLRPYFTVLCQTLGASMIQDRERITLKVETDDSVTTPEASVSLGLVVTELVINALKHAFPDRSRDGHIVVDYRANGPAWTLSVSDDGVGMAAEPHLIPTGLGTSIVTALASQLGAEVRIEPGNPGTMVLVEHA
ncbi:histidine kinase dimerization/phosphoacceptor domain -containing protein [soil metagenome]